MRGGGSYSKIGDFNLNHPNNPMKVINRSPDGTKITYKFKGGKDFLYDVNDKKPSASDNLVSLKFSLDETEKTNWTGITKVSLRKDGEYYVAEVTLSKTSTTAALSVENLPPSTPNNGEATYNIVSGTSLTLASSPSNDVLIGGDGDDTLKAYGGKKEEVDILTGGFGADTFVLGDRNAQGQSDFGSSYQGSGHAIITDFHDYEGDKIQLLKNGNYQLKFEDKHIGGTTNDTTIYYKGDIIAYVQDVQLTSLSSDNFTFV